MIARLQAVEHIVRRLKEPAARPSTFRTLPSREALLDGIDGTIFVAGDAGTRTVISTTATAGSSAKLSPV